jgi:hypothetical protein
MSSNWINFVKQFAYENNIPYKEALQEAKPYYHASGYGNPIRKGPSFSRGGKKKRRMTKGGADEWADALLGYNGGVAQKGALAALLSGLNIKIE